MLMVLLVRGLTLPGAISGIKFYLYPDPTRLTDPQVKSIYLEIAEKSYFQNDDFFFILIFF